MPSSLFIPLPQFAREGAPAPQLHALHWPATHASSAPPLFCVHGLTRQANDFAAVAETLCTTRTIYSFDMPGRGQSSWLSDPALYTYPTYAGCMLAALKHLGLTQVDWLGTSMGGLIGLMLAAPNKFNPTPPIRKLILNDIGPFIPLAALQRIADHVRNQPFFTDLRQAEIYCLKSYASFGITGAENWEKFTRDSVRAAHDENNKRGYRLHYDPAIATAFGELKADVDLWQMYDSVTTPTLLLRGETSDTLPPSTAREMTQRGPHANLVTIPHCGHAPALLDAFSITAIQHFLDAP